MASQSNGEYLGIKYDYSYSKIKKAYNVCIHFRPKINVSFTVNHEDNITKITKSAITKYKKEFSNNTNDKKVNNDMKALIKELLFNDKSERQSSVLAITKKSDIAIGAALMPKDSDIIETSEVYVILDIKGVNAQCISFNKDEIVIKLIQMNDIEQNYLKLFQLDIEEIESIVNIRKNIEELNKALQSSYDSIKSSIESEVSNVNNFNRENSLDNCIYQSIIQSNFNGYIKKKMIDEWENSK